MNPKENTVSNKALIASVCAMALMASVPAWAQNGASSGANSGAPGTATMGAGTPGPSRASVGGTPMTGANAPAVVGTPNGMPMRGGTDTTQTQMSSGGINGNDASGANLGSTGTGMTGRRHTMSGTHPHMGRHHGTQSASGTMSTEELNARSLQAAQSGTSMAGPSGMSGSGTGMSGPGTGTSSGRM